MGGSVVAKGVKPLMVVVVARCKTVVVVEVVVFDVVDVVLVSLRVKF